MSEQESGKRSQEEELVKLKEQLDRLKKEEADYKQKVGVGGAKARVVIYNADTARQEVGYVCVCVCDVRVCVLCRWS